VTYIGWIIAVSRNLYSYTGDCIPRNGGSSSPPLQQFCCSHGSAMPGRSLARRLVSRRNFVCRPDRPQAGGYNNSGHYRGASPDAQIHHLITHIVLRTEDRPPLHQAASPHISAIISGAAKAFAHRGHHGDQDGQAEEAARIHRSITWLRFSETNRKCARYHRAAGSTGPNPDFSAW
jgi:hypothetical protein